MLDIYWRVITNIEEADIIEQCFIRMVVSVGGREVVGVGGRE